MMTYITESSVVIADLLFKAFNVTDNLVEIEELLRHFSILFEKNRKGLGALLTKFND